MSAVIAVTTLIPLLKPGFYNKETFNWQVQSLGQDGINLILIVPMLIITSVLQYKGNSKVSPVWAGTMLYITYTYAIYCFNVHFNYFFIAYCFTFGSSFYSVLCFLYTFRDFNHESESKHSHNTRVVTASYFLIIAVLFSFLWLSDLIPSILQNRVPSAITETGLYTNPVHILDLSILLPGLFATGVLLLKRKNLANGIAPVLLAFFIFMDLTIAALTVVMFKNNLVKDVSVAGVMIFLAIVSSVLLTLNLKYRHV